MRRRYYVTQIRKTEQGYKFVFIPRDFPSDWAFIRIYENYIEISPYYPQKQEKKQEQKQDNDPDLFEEFDKMQRGL
ncbi:MAG: hypothetical protein QXN57_06320 [Desulfurococcaceae archaeon]